MIRNAVGIVISRITVAATANRTIAMLLARMSTTVGPSSTSPATVTTVTTSSNGTIVKMTLPGKVSRFHDLPTTVIGNCLAAVPRRAELFARSFVDAAHDRIEGGHDRHGVSDQMPGHQHADRLEVDERRVVDAQPERLVRAVAHGIHGVLAAR